MGRIPPGFGLVDGRPIVPGLWEEAYEGLYALADEYQVTIVGGDTVRAPFLVLNVTVLGEARERAVRRSGAKPGEKLAVTGRLGASAAGLALLLAGEEVKSRIPAEVVKDLVDAHLRPAPRVREAGLLVAAGNPSAILISATAYVTPDILPPPAGGVLITATGCLSTTDQSGGRRFEQGLSGMGPLRR